MNEPATNDSPLLRPPPELVRPKHLSIADLLLITLGTAIGIQGDSLFQDAQEF